MTAFPFSSGTRRLIELSLYEDLAAGDVTSDAIFAGDQISTAHVYTKQQLVLAGSYVFDEVFRSVDPEVEIVWSASDGDLVGKGSVARVTGRTRSVLRAERPALNFLRHMSGVASITNDYVSKLGDGGPKLVDTRKTTPGFRELEKYSVRMGGGYNHRYNLGAGAMIKDNHIAAAGSIAKAVAAVREHAPFLIRVEVEVTNLDELAQAIDAGADAVLLDNMTTAMMADAVRYVDGRAIVEASGNITGERLAELTSIGLDVISSGAVTHSAPNVDISLELVDEKDPADILKHVGKKA